MRSFWSLSDKTFLTAEQGDVSGFMQHLREHGVQSRSIARKLSCVRGFYKWLLMDKRVKRDPTVNIESPSSWKVLPKSLAESEVSGDAGEDGRGGEGGGCGCGRRCGIMRCSSCCMRVGCAWARLLRCGRRTLRLETASVQVRGKGDKERIVPIGRECGGGAGGVYVHGGAAGWSEEGDAAGAVF